MGKMSGVIVEQEPDEFQKKKPPIVSTRATLLMITQADWGANFSLPSVPAFCDYYGAESFHCKRFRLRIAGFVQVWTAALKIQFFVDA
jgi:hypothetical protein